MGAAEAVLGAAVDLLEDANSDGCDGLIVVSIGAYRDLQKAVKAATGRDHGEVHGEVDNG